MTNIRCSDTFSSLQPTYFPGFAFSWMSLISHRLFMPKLLLSENREVSSIIVLLATSYCSSLSYIRAGPLSIDFFCLSSSSCPLSSMPPIFNPPLGTYTGVLFDFSWSSYTTSLNSSANITSASAMLSRNAASNSATSSSAHFRLLSSFLTPTSATSNSSLSQRWGPSLPSCRTSHPSSKRVN